MLVIDDDPHILRIFVRAVEHKGTIAAGASSFAEAKVLMEAMRPDLVVTDFELGDGNGVELMHFARGIGVTAPALLVSATPPSPTETEGLFADVVLKPFHLNTLLDALYVLKGSVRKPALSGKRLRYVDALEQTLIPLTDPMNKPEVANDATPSVVARIVPKKILKKG